MFIKLSLHKWNLIQNSILHLKQPKLLIQQQVQNKRHFKNPQHNNHHHYFSTTTLLIVQSAHNNNYDVVGISNLCIDVIVPVDKLPNTDHQSKKDLLSHLNDHPVPQENWEVGGMCNFLIAASRLGLQTLSVGKYTLITCYYELFNTTLL